MNPALIKAVAAPSAQPSASSLSDPLLAPISDASPCGEDLSYSADFDAIARMREADDPSLDQGEWVTPLKVADWPGVVRRSAELLAHRSKDLRLASWLTEALACTEGYPGLTRGLLFTAQLARAYWPHVHPLPDGGDQEERIGNIAWLLARVHEQARRLPVVRGKSASYSLADVAQVRALAARVADGSAAPDGLADPKLLPDRLARAQRETPTAFWADNLAAAREAVQALSELQQVIDLHLGDHGPSFVAAREALTEAVADIERLARESGAWVGATNAVAATELATELPGGAAAASSAASPAASQLPAQACRAEVSVGPLVSRAQALQRLQEVAEYFRRTEPHSPVAYLADKAVQWGNMPLHEWLRVVLKDAGSLSHVEELLGIAAAGGADPGG